VQDGGYLVGVSFNTLLSHQIAQVLPGGHFEGAFLRIESELLFSEAIKSPARQRKTIFRTCLVEIGEVDADSPFATLLLHQDRIG